MLFDMQIKKSEIKDDIFSKDVIFTSNYIISKVGATLKVDSTLVNTKSETEVRMNHYQQMDLPLLVCIADEFR